MRLVVHVVLVLLSSLLCLAVANAFSMLMRRCSSFIWLRAVLWLLWLLYLQLVGVSLVACYFHVPLHSSARLHYIPSFAASRHLAYVLVAVAFGRVSAVAVVCLFSLACACVHA